jgi:hypothetical protein
LYMVEWLPGLVYMRTIVGGCLKIRDMAPPQIRHFSTLKM